MHQGIGQTITWSSRHPYKYNGDLTVNR